MESIYPFPRIKVVGRKMLAVRCDFEIRTRINTALKSINKVKDILRDVEGIFSGCLLATTPARILEWIDVRSEKVKPGASSIVESASLGADDSRNGFDQVHIESCPENYWLREGCS